MQHCAVQSFPEEQEKVACIKSASQMPSHVPKNKLAAELPAPSPNKPTLSHYFKFSPLVQNAGIINKA